MIIVNLPKRESEFMNTEFTFLVENEIPTDSELTFPDDAQN